MGSGSHQDGALRAALAGNSVPYHPIKPQGVLLGQEQVSSCGGRDRVRGKWGPLAAGEEPHNRRLGRERRSVLGRGGERGSRESKVGGSWRGKWFP